MKTELTLCDRCEDLNGPCDKKTTSPWTCYKRILAHTLIRPHVEAIVSVLCDAKLFERHDMLNTNEYLPGNLTNAILDELEKDCSLMIDISGKKNRVVAEEYNAGWEFENKLKWEKIVKKSWEKKEKREKKK